MTSKYNRFNATISLSLSSPIKMCLLITEQNNYIIISIQCGAPAGKAERRCRDMTEVSKQQKKHNILFASRSNETHQLSSIWMLLVLLKQCKLKSIYQNSEQLNNICFNIVRSKGICLEPKNLGQTYQTLITYESSRSSGWLPDHVQGQLITSIWAKLLDKMVDKIPGCPRKNTEPEKYYQLSMPC